MLINTANLVSLIFSIRNARLQVFHLLARNIEHFIHVLQNLRKRRPFTSIPTDHRLDHLTQILRVEILNFRQAHFQDILIILIQLNIQHLTLKHQQTQSKNIRPEHVYLLDTSVLA